MEVSTSAATACFCSFRSCIWAWITARRWSGSSIPTGSSANIADTRLLYVPSNT